MADQQILVAAALRFDIVENQQILAVEILKLNLLVVSYLRKEKKTVVTTDSSTSKTEEEKVCIPFCQFKVMIDRKVH